MADETTVVAQSDATEQHTPEVAETPKPTEGGETEHPEGNQEHTEQEEKRKRLGGWQRKIQRLEQSEAYWRNVALSTQQTQRPAQEQPKAEAESDPEPKAEDFEDMQSYLAAVRAWDRKQVQKEVLSTIEKRNQETQHKSEQQTVAQRWQTAEAEFATAHDDYADATEDAINALTNSYKASPKTVEAIRDAVQMAENGPELLYLLGKNADELSRIASLSPAAALMELGALKAQVAKPKAEAKEETPVAPPPPQTKAPAPPTPVKKPSTVAHVDLNDPNTPVDVWLKERNKQLQRR